MRGRKRHRKKRERWAREHRRGPTMRTIMVRFGFQAPTVALRRHAAIMRLYAAMLRPTRFERQMAEVLRLSRLSGLELGQLKRAAERLGRDE